MDTNTSGQQLNSRVPDVNSRDPKPDSGDNVHATVAGHKIRVARDPETNETWMNAKDLVAAGIIK